MPDVSAKNQHKNKGPDLNYEIWPHSNRIIILTICFTSYFPYAPSFASRMVLLSCTTTLCQAPKGTWMPYCPSRGQTRNLAVSTKQLSSAATSPLLIGLPASIFGRSTSGCLPLSFLFEKKNSFYNYIELNKLQTIINYLIDAL